DDAFQALRPERGQVGGVNESRRKKTESDRQKWDRRPLAGTPNIAGQRPAVPGPVRSFAHGFKTYSDTRRFLCVSSRVGAGFASYSRCTSLITSSEVIGCWLIFVMMSPRETPATSPGKPDCTPMITTPVV